MDRIGCHRITRNLEATRQVWFADPQDDHADRDGDEGDECADRHQVPQVVEWDEAGEDTRDCSDDDRVVHRCHAARVDLGEHRGKQPVAAHREQDAGLAVHHDERDREDRDHRTGSEDRAGPGRAVENILQDDRKPGLGLFFGSERFGGLRAQAGERHQECQTIPVVMAISAANDRARHGLLRILHLVTGPWTRCRVPCEREEDGPRYCGYPGKARVPAPGEMVGGERGESDRDEHASTPNLRSP